MAITCSRAVELGRGLIARPSRRGERRRLGTEDTAAAIVMRAGTFLGEQRLDRGSRDMALDAAGLLVETLYRGELLGMAEPGLGDGRAQHADRAIIDLERHGIGMAILAAVCEREPPDR